MACGIGDYSKDIIPTEISLISHIDTIECQAKRLETINNEKIPKCNRIHEKTDICEVLNMIKIYILDTKLSNITHTEIMNPISKVIKTDDNSSFVFITPKKVIKIVFFPVIHYKNITLLEKFINEVNIHFYINTIQKGNTINCFINMLAVRFFEERFEKQQNPNTVHTVPKLTTFFKKFIRTPVQPQLNIEIEPAHVVACIPPRGYHSVFEATIRSKVTQHNSHRVGFIYLDKAQDICEYIQLHIQLHKDTHTSHELLINNLIEMFYNLIITFSKSAVDFLSTPLNGNVSSKKIHNHFFTHNDIKLDNIMISTKDNILKLIDFGNSKLQATFHDVNNGSNLEQVRWLFKDAPSSPHFINYPFKTSSLLFDIFQIIITLLILLLWVSTINITHINNSDISYKAYNVYYKKIFPHRPHYYLLRNICIHKFLRESTKSNNLEKLIDLSDIIYLYYNSLRFKYMSTNIRSVPDKHHINTEVYHINKFTIDNISIILKDTKHGLSIDECQQIDECLRISKTTITKYKIDLPNYDLTVNPTYHEKQEHHFDHTRNFQDINHVMNMINHILKI